MFLAYVISHVAVNWEYQEKKALFYMYRKNFEFFRQFVFNIFQAYKKYIAKICGFEAVSAWRIHIYQYFVIMNQYFIWELINTTTAA